MALVPLTGFQSLTTHHCISGSLRHVYVYNDHSLSEEMLLGLGNGVGFVYWHAKGMEPFMGGRGNARGGFEPLVGQRTGVKIEAHTTASARKAEQALLEMLARQQPVMIQCDMGFLPYFDFAGYDYHFGGHAVVVCGYDAAARQVLLADRDEGLHPVTLEVLAQARGSTYKPFPPRNLWYTFDFSGKRPPAAAEVRQAIAEQAKEMLAPPIQNLGVPGIRKAARLICRWPEHLPEDVLRNALFNAYIFIDPAGGSGGGLFRYMFGRFLREAADIAGEPRLLESAVAFQHIGDRWQELAAIFHHGFEAADPTAALAETTAPLQELADLEDAAWMRLRELAGA